MMITKFNKRKCLFKEIVNIPELWSSARRASSISSIFLTAICCVIKISRMHEHRSRFVSNESSSLTDVWSRTRASQKRNERETLLCAAVLFKLNN